MPDLRCVLSPLDTPGCFGRRNCNVNLDDLRWDRPDLDCEPQQARDIPEIFNWTRQRKVGRGGVNGVLLKIIGGTNIIRRYKGA